MPSVKRAHLSYFAELKKQQKSQKARSVERKRNAPCSGLCGNFAELKNSKNRRKPGAWRESGTLHEVGFVGILRNLK